MRAVDKFDNYLGLPLCVGKNKNDAFKFLMDRCTSKIKGWSKRLVSRGGKDLFLKAVVQSLPTYSFSMFLLPKGITDKLEAWARSFWWERKNKGRGWSMLSRDRLCSPKGMGGMGFKDIRLFNLALLGRQLWRLVNNKNTLCYKVISMKYFPSRDPFDSK